MKNEQEEAAESICEYISGNQYSTLYLDVTKLDGHGLRYYSDSDKRIIRFEFDERIADLLVRALKQNTAVTTVTLINSVWYRPHYLDWSERLLQAIGQLPSLQELKLDGSSKFNENEIRALFAGINERRNLKRFTLGAVALDSKETYDLLLKLLKVHPNLEEIRLERSPPVSRKGNGSHISIPLRQLSQSIPSWPNLKKLELCHFRNAKSHDKDLVLVSQALAEARSLQSFQLNNYRSSRSGSQGFSVLMDALANLEGLQEFTFRFGLVNESDASSMARAIPNSKSLVNVALPYTFRDDKWYKNVHVADCFVDLFSSKSVKTLDISGTLITEDRMRVMLDALEKNYVLEQVVRDHCKYEYRMPPTSPDIHEMNVMMDRMINLNKAGRGIMMGDSQPTIAQLVDVLVKANEYSTPDLVYHLIRESPHQRALMESALATFGPSELDDAPRVKRRKICTSK